jgi:hypothetical protein
MRGNDTLYIRREGHINIAAPIVLSLAEKLGYSLIKTNVSSWVYRRDQPFQV